MNGWDYDDNKVNYEVGGAEKFLGGGKNFRKILIRPRRFSMTLSILHTCVMCNITSYIYAIVTLLFIIPWVILWLCNSWTTELFSYLLYRSEKMISVCGYHCQMAWNCNMVCPKIFECNFLPDIGKYTKSSRLTFWSY